MWPFSKKKPYKFPPNIFFYKDGEMVRSVYAERGEALEQAVKKAKKDFGNIDGYMSRTPTGRSAFFDLRKKKRKKWGSH